MPSGKKSSGGTPAPRQASPRVLAGLAVALTLIAVAIVLAVVLNRGHGSAVGPLPANGSLAAGLPEAADVNRLLEGIPQRGLTLGSASAPVTLVEYIDLQCPYCREFETTVMPGLIARYVRAGKARVEVRLLDFIGPDSSRGRDATIAAGLQNKAFNFAQLLYDNQQSENTGWLDDTMVAQAAKSITGLSPKQLFARRGSATVRAKASASDRQATADAIKGTPTLFVGQTGERGGQVTLASPTDERAPVQAIRAALGS